MFKCQGRGLLLLACSVSPSSWHSLLLFIALFVGIRSKPVSFFCFNSHNILTMFFFLLTNICCLPNKTRQSIKCYNTSMDKMNYLSLGSLSAAIRQAMIIQNSKHCNYVKTQASMGRHLTQSWVIRKGFYESISSQMKYSSRYNPGK